MLPDIGKVRLCLPAFFTAKHISIACLIFITSVLCASAQCIDRKKIAWSNDGLFYNYGYLCPAYFFSVDGDTSKNWNIRFENIDIKQAPSVALKFKQKVDSAIKSYAGEHFFNDLKFINIQVCYPEKLKFFKDNGAFLSTLKHYKCRYIYNYSLDPDSLTGYNICVGVTSQGKIITPFIFPAKNSYKSIIKKINYCQLIEIAKKAQKNIEPIDRISFGYDKRKKMFYWLISQEVVDIHEGINNVNQVIIDAADLNKVRTMKVPVSVVF